MTTQHVIDSCITSLCILFGVLGSFALCLSGINHAATEKSYRECIAKYTPTECRRG